MSSSTDPPVHSSLLKSDRSDSTHILLKRTSQVLICPYCCQSVQTSIRFRSGATAWLCSLGICLIGGGAGCCLIPFFGARFKDCEHFCPVCQHFLGRAAYFNL